MIKGNKMKDSLIEAIKGSSKVIGATAVFDAASAAIIPVIGFTTEGVGASTIAAGIQSSIGAVKAGSWFAYLQSVGALGQGVLGAAGLPVVIAVTASGAVIYIVYKNREEEIESFLSNNKEKLQSQLKEWDAKLQVSQKFSDSVDKISESAKDLTDKATNLAKQIPGILKNLINPKPKL